MGRHITPLGDDPQYPDARVGGFMRRERSVGNS